MLTHNSMVDTPGIGDSTKDFAFSWSIDVESIKDDKQISKSLPIGGRESLGIFIPRFPLPNPSYRCPHCAIPACDGWRSLSPEYMVTVISGTVTSVLGILDLDVDKYWRTPLKLPAAGWYEAVVKLSLEKLSKISPVSGSTLRLYAVWHRHEAAVKLPLLDRGAGLDYGSTIASCPFSIPLHQDFGNREMWPSLHLTVCSNESCSALNIFKLGQATFLDFQNPGAKE
jgi:hypothetical protein